MINIIVRLEQPKKYEDRNRAIETKAENEKKMVEFQDKILDLIVNV